MSLQIALKMPQIICFHLDGGRTGFSIQWCVWFTKITKWLKVGAVFVTCIFFLYTLPYLVQSTATTFLSNRCRYSTKNSPYLDISGMLDLDASFCWLLAGSRFQKHRLRLCTRWTWLKHLQHLPCSSHEAQRSLNASLEVLWDILEPLVADGSLCHSPVEHWYDFDLQNGCNQPSRRTKRRPGIWPHRVNGWKRKECCEWS